jgi:hypothetical protein
VEESPDIVLPEITGAEMNYDTGFLTVKSSEMIDVTPGSLVNMSRIVFKNETSEEAITMPLLGSLFTFMQWRDEHGNFRALDAATLVQKDDPYNLTFGFNLTEAQRAAIISISGVPGGDSSSILLDFLASAVQDIGQNSNIGTLGLPVTEFPDITPPRVLACSIDLNDGLITFVSSETVDVTPPTNTDLSLIRFYRSVNDARGELSVPLAGVLPNFGRWVDGTRSFKQNDSATQIAIDGTSIKIQLEESQRAAIIEISMSHGIGFTLMGAQGLQNAIQDVSGNKNEEVWNISVTEVRDSTKPFIKSCSIDYNNGHLTILVSETIDVTPATNVALEKVAIGNISKGKNISLVTSSITEIDGLNLTIKLSEPQRVDAIIISGTQGGDGSAAIVDARESFVRDLADNPSTATLNVSLFEVADTTAPILLSASLNFSTGKLICVASETIDVRQKSFVRLSLFNIIESLGSNETAPRDSLHSYFSRNYTAIELHSKAATLKTVNDPVTLSFELFLTEAQRIAALVRSGTPGGDGSSLILRVEQGGVRDVATNLNAFEFNIGINETADTIPPALTFVSLDVALGLLVMTFSETIDATPSYLVNTTKMTIKDVSRNSSTSIPMSDAFPLPNFGTWLNENREPVKYAEAIVS